MLKNYVKIAFRNLRKHKLYAGINVVGLAIGLACCLLIVMLVRHEWSFDRFHAKGDRIYRVLIEETTPDGSPDFHQLIPPNTSPALAETFPAIEAFTRVVIGQRDVRVGDERFQEQLMMVDSLFFDLFTYPLLAGDPATALDDPQNVVLTEPVARKYFGTADAGVLGRTITIERGENRYDFTVSGVLAPIPSNSSLQFDVLLSFRQYDTLPLGGNDWGGRTSLYVLLSDDQDPAALEAAFPAFTTVEFADRIAERRASGYIAESDDAFKLVLQPLSQMHHEPEKGAGYEVTPRDPLYSYILSAIALLVLLLACINFMTLSIGRSTSRAREVGLRKVLGAHRRQLMRQFWGEALLMTVLALTLGLLLMWLALPTFNTLTGKTLDLTDFADAASLLALVALVVFVGLVAGGYPAFILSRFQPATVLKGDLKTGSRSRLSSGLVVVQYALSIALLICTVVMYRQLDYLLTKDLGFDGEAVVAVQTPRLTTEQEQTAIRVFRNELAGRPDVAGVARTAYSFTQSYDTFGWTAADGTPFQTHNVGVDFGYLDLMGMELVAGRDFDPNMPTDSSNVIVNEAFVRKFNIEEPIGYVLTGLEEDSFLGANPTIIGVVEDFNFRSLRDEVEPAMLNINPNYYMGMGAILVKIQGESAPATIARLERIWTNLFPERPFAYSFVDADMDAQYQDERRWRTILTYSAGLAVLIACLGLFGLATLTVVRRTKEIGIRKVLGASAPGIAGLVAREFAILVGIATLLAWPLAYFGMRRWLDTFAYRIDLPWWAFLAAGVGALGIALLAIGYHAIRAATADPVKSLRYE